MQVTGHRSDQRSGVRSQVTHKNNRTLDFKIKANYLHYFQLIAAIPLDLKRKAFGSTVPDLLGATSECCQLEDRTIALTKFHCKTYYRLFI